MSQTIYTSAGGTEYTWPITLTENAGKDISGDTVQLSLGTFDAPGTSWLNASVDQPQANTATRVVQLLVDTSVLAGDYWIWIKVGDTPEVVVRRAGQLTVR